MMHIIITTSVLNFGVKYIVLLRVLANNIIPTDLLQLLTTCLQFLILLIFSHQFLIISILYG